MVVSVSNKATAKGEISFFTVENHTLYTLLDSLTQQRPYKLPLTLTALTPFDLCEIYPLSIDRARPSSYVTL